MSIHHYVGGTGWTSGGTEVTVEFPTVPELTTAAQGGEGGSGSVIVTDPTGTLDLRGWNRYRAEESACTTRPLIYPGFVKGKKIRRGAEGPRGIGRVWECELGDLNLLAHLVAFKTSDANRPAETFATRMAWFLASSVVSGLFSDTGYVITGHDSVALDAADYRRRYPDDVTGDISSQTGWDWFIFWDYTAAAPSLFLNLRDAAILDSSLSISNFASEANDTTIFSTGHSSETEDAVLDRDPDEVYSAVDLYWVGGETHRSSSTTAAAYIARSFVYESTRIGRATTAATIADQFILDHAIEKDILTIPVRLPKSLVNMIAAGERLAVHLEHLHFASGTDYGGAGYVYVRVARRTVSQAELDFYDLILTCTNFGKSAMGGGGGTGGFPHQPPGPAIHFYSDTFNIIGDETWVPNSPFGLISGLQTCATTTTTLVADTVYNYDMLLTMEFGSASTGLVELVNDDLSSTLSIPLAKANNTGSGPDFANDAGVYHFTGSFTAPDAAHLKNPYRMRGETGQFPHGNDVKGSLTFWIDPDGWDSGSASNPPERGQWVGISPPETVTLTAGAGTTEFPFADGSLRVFYDIVEQTAAIVSYDGAAGTFQMPSQPPLGTQVFVQYQGR